jgi:quercetin dioxygenase-like cupin family protein
MRAFEFSDLTQQREKSGKLYLEFLKVPSLSMGLYELKAGSKDPQKPHNEDEVYYVVNGHGKILVENEDREVKPGSIIYVAANAVHLFHSITEDLSILAFFAPAEYSKKQS